MKTSKIIFGITFGLALLTSCENGYDELNTSKTKTDDIDPALILNNAILNSSPGGVSPGINTSALTYDLAIVQQLITSNSGVQVGGNFNQVNIGNTPLTWQNYFQNVIRYTSDVIRRTEGDAARANLYNMARIVQANAFMVLTDTYGDIPYSEAGKAYPDFQFFPKYDKQETIYPSLITEITAATQALSDTAPVETADFLFNGAVAKWRKFGYSLLLRAGMRLSKVNPTLAESTVEAAVAGGVILQNADNIVIIHDNNLANAYGNTLNGTEAANFYLAEPFVDALKTTNDPRLKAIAIRYVGATGGSGQIAANGTTDPANQYGMPVGSDDANAQAAAVAAGLGSRYAFSQADRTKIMARSAPAFLITAAQCNLLLAEATARGWINTGTSAETYFREGIKAHMDQMALYNPAMKIEDAARDAYLDANPLDISSLESSLEEINYQYWIASFLNGPEAWANLRRSGYPELEINPFSGRTVDFIHRITYPPSELAVNTQNVNSASESMGGDELDTRVWWDVP